MVTIQGIKPCLWFNMNAEEAVNFYVSVFPNSRIGDVSRYPEGSPVAAGTVLVMEFELDGLPLQALNGGAQFPFTEAISLSVSVEEQADIDYLWQTLSAGGEKGVCGWLKDRFGLSWQLAPAVIASLLANPDPAKAAAVNAVLMQQTRPIIADLVAAGR